MGKRVTEAEHAVLLAVVSTASPNTRKGGGCKSWNVSTVALPLEKRLSYKLALLRRVEDVVTAEGKSPGRSGRNDHFSFAVALGDFERSRALHTRKASEHLSAHVENTKLG